MPEETVFTLNLLGMGGLAYGCSFGLSCVASDSEYEYDECEELPVELLCRSTSFFLMILSHCVATETVVSPDSLSVLGDAL